MRRRAGIARALVAKPKLVLLDDPTGGLDPVAASVILELVSELQSSHELTVISISHDIRRLLPKVERLWVMMDGQLVCDLATERLWESAPKEAIEFLSSRYDFPEAECATSGTNGQSL
jgi:ABC-type transporter Mla maintaining outer membrane lipid asymmetry ATPase subunit MlaF